jgi:hypothetical protein
MNPLLKLAGTIIDKVIFAYCVYKSKIINKLMGGVKDLLVTRTIYAVQRISLQKSR